MYNNRQYNVVDIAGKVTNQSIFTGAGTLAYITINGAGTGGTITVTDTSSPSVSFIVTVPSAAVTLSYFRAIAGGLQITTSASPNISVMYANY